MKVLLVLALISVAAAAPKATKLQYKNLYKDSPNVDNHPVPRIIGGQEATPNSIPYQVYIEVSDFSGTWLCGATLISANYILTAGHCGDGGTSARVVLGAHRPQQNEATQVVLESSDITVHEDFDIIEIINDVAVIGLPSAVSFTNAIQPVTLPSRSDVGNSFAGAAARISGWGLTDGFDTTISDVLNYVDTEIITNQECENQFGLSVATSNICTTGAQNTGSCNGDSGGPLVTDNKQVGIVSFGIRYCPPGYPSAFTRVTDFLDWIEANTDVVIS